jgi:hypothetical protein
MKTLKEYLAESVKEYSYKIKILGEVEDGMMDTIENELKKYDLKIMGSPTKTIFQKQPLDFDEGVSGEVNIASFTTGLPLSKDTVRDRIAHQLGMTERYIKIRSENDPLEYDLVDNNVDTEIVVGESNPEDAVLNNDYPADEHKAEDYHGNEFNTKFMEELMKLVKDRDTHVSNYMKEE